LDRTNICLCPLPNLQRVTALKREALFSFCHERIDCRPSPRCRQGSSAIFPEARTTTSRPRSPNKYSKKSGSDSAFWVNVGLDYLTLDRVASTLSGGESATHSAGYPDRLALGRSFVHLMNSHRTSPGDNGRLLNTLIELAGESGEYRFSRSSTIGETIQRADYVMRSSVRRRCARAA